MVTCYDATYYLVVYKKLRMGVVNAPKSRLSYLLERAHFQSRWKDREQEYLNCAKMISSKTFFFWSSKHQKPLIARKQNPNNLQRLGSTWKNHHWLPIIMLFSWIEMWSKLTQVGFINLANRQLSSHMVARILDFLIISSTQVEYNNNNMLNKHSEIPHKKL